MKKLIIYNKKFDKKEIKNLIEWFICNYGSIKTCKILHNLKVLGLKFSTKAGISIGIEDLVIPEIKKDLIINTENLAKKYKLNLFKGNISKIEYLQKVVETWNITNETLKEEIITNFQQTNLLNPVYLMIFSGARGNISQIKQLVGMRGLMSDSKGEIINLPITANLKEGLNSNDYFISCYGARKGIIDTALKTANSGYLTRRLIYSSQNIFIKQPDCYTKLGNLIKVLKKSKKNYLITKEKILGRIAAENIKEIKSNKLIISKNQDICNYTVKKIVENKNYVFIRTPLKCLLNTGICQLCYGWNLTNNKIVKLGESIGILAAQSIGEPGTQLTMRTFHTGGIFTAKKKRVIQAPINGIVKYSKKNTKRLITNYKEKALFLEKEKRFFIKENKINLLTITIPKFSIIFIKKNQKIFKKQIIAEIPKWIKSNENKVLNKNNKIEYIRTYNSGQIHLINKKKNKLWIINGFIIKYNNRKEFLKRDKIKKNITYTNKKTYSKKEINLFKKKIQFKKLISNKKIITKIKRSKEKKFFLKKKTYELKKKQKNELLINKTNTKKIIEKNKIGKFVQQNKKKKIKYPGQIIEVRKNSTSLKRGIAYMIANKSNLKVKENHIVEKNNTLFKLIFKKEKTKDIVEGLPKIEEILEIKKKNSSSIKMNIQKKTKKYFTYYKTKYNNSLANRKTINKIQNYLIKQIQEVYKSQNVNLSEKHIEVIVKQMTSKVMLTKKGESNLIPGEIIDINKIEKINQNLKKKANYEPIILGISQIPKINNSFISAICFQETTQILTKSAVNGKIDWLKGLKENLIMGNLIPTGTGYKINS
uniref:DNA-directed RNA polymerase n=1 Tax=Phacus pleuronectes TaxID=102908 RepID=A0A3G3LLS5_9EUGL|nr:RNA polymerase beta'' subunit [Phacus pleuronectes]AYQ93659.1 RNA polymerase beta'' subunit [Phacus pleuronectes]